MRVEFVFWSFSSSCKITSSGWVIFITIPYLRLHLTFCSISCFTPLSSSPSPSPRVSLPSLSLLLLLQLQLSSVLYMILSLSLLPQESLPVGSWDRETSPGDWNLPQTGRRTKDCIWEKRNHLLWLLPAVVSPVCTTEYLRTFASNTFC